jgi:hypothetical protein
MDNELKEDGIGGGNGVGGVAGDGATIQPDSKFNAPNQSEPGVDRKKKKLRSIIMASPLKRLTPNAPK